MDEVFGRKNFKNEIVWSYEKWTNSASHFQRNHDVILFYSNGESNRFNKLYGEFTKRQKQLFKTGYNLGSTSGGERIVRVYDRSKAEDFIDRWISEGRVIYYVDAPKGKALSDVWSISLLNGRSRERTGYPTQKPLALLERIIKASSNEGDMVLDPFCGCATTCVAAEKLGRQWVGIDISPKAAELVKDRINRELGILLFKPIHRFDVPTDKDGKRSKNIKHILYGMQEGKCTGCLTHFPFQNFEVDHIIPKSKGGADTDDNLQLLCGYCNRVKGDRSMEHLISRVRMTA